MADNVMSRWVDSAELVPADVFDGRYFCTTVGWTRAWEHVRTERVRAFRHLVLEGGQVPELVPYFLVDYSPVWHGYEKTAGVPPIWSDPVVYSSTVYGVNGGAGGTSADYRVRAIDMGLEQATRWGAEALVFSNLQGWEIDAWSAVRPSGHAVLLDLAYEAPLNAVESEFIARMPSKVRRELARQWRRATESGVQLRALEGQHMRPYLEEFTRLAIDSSEQHTDNIYGPEMIRNLVSVPGAVLLVAEYEDTMAGGFLCFHYRGRFSLVIAGLDYERLHTLNTYAFLMYESLRYASANEAGVIDVGRCNYAYKERHGFEGKDVWALVFQTGAGPDASGALERMNKGIHEYLARNSGRR